MPGPVFLRGEQVSLRSLSEADLPFLARHHSDPRVRRGFGWTRPRTAPGTAEWFEQVRDRDDELHLLVCDGDDPVGEVFLLRIDDRQGRADLGYWVAPDAQEAGYATDAATTVVEYAFAERGLRRLQAIAWESNEASRRVLAGLGFEQEGVAREWGRLDGEREDMVRYGLLAREWRERSE